MLANNAKEVGPSPADGPLRSIACCTTQQHNRQVCAGRGLISLDLITVLVVGVTVGWLVLFSFLFAFLFVCIFGWLVS